MIVRYCKKCQSETERLVNSGRCKKCNDANSAAYKLANPGKLKSTAKAWRIANPEKYKASIAASRAKNPQYKAQAKARTAAWRLANPDKVKTSVKAKKFALYEAYYLANNH